MNEPSESVSKTRWELVCTTSVELPSFAGGTGDDTGFWTGCPAVSPFSSDAACGVFDGVSVEGEPAFVETFELVFTNSGRSPFRFGLGDSAGLTWVTDRVGVPIWRQPIRVTKWPTATSSPTGIQ